MNDYLDITVKEGDIVLSKKFRHLSLAERAKEYDGRMGPYEEISWGNPKGRESW